MSRPQYPPPAEGMTRVTQSDLERYLKCGIRYDLERRSKHRHATIPMAIGTAVAAGAAEDNRTKMARGRGLGILDLVEASVAGYVSEVEESEIEATRLELSEGKDDAAAAARTYSLRVSPFIKEPLFVEEPIVAHVGDSLELCGKPDTIDTEGLWDTKVGKQWSQEDADRSRQHTYYGFLHRARLGYWPRRLGVDNVYRVRGEWKAQRLFISRTPADYAALLEIVRRAVSGIKAGIFLPAPEGAWWCSHSWCPLFKKCPVMNGGKP